MRSARFLQSCSIGFTLLAEGFGQKIPKGYVYAAMAFSVFVETLNIGVRRKTKEPLNLHDRMSPEPDSEYAAVSAPAESTPNPPSEDEPS